MHFLCIFSETDQIYSTPDQIKSYEFLQAMILDCSSITFGDIQKQNRSAFKQTHIVQSAHFSPISCFTTFFQIARIYTIFQLFSCIIYEKFSYWLPFLKP